MWKRAALIITSCLIVISIYTLLSYREARKAAVGYSLDYVEEKYEVSNETLKVGGVHYDFGRGWYSIKVVGKEKNYYIEVKVIGDQSLYKVIDSTDDYIKK